MELVLNELINEINYDDLPDEWTMFTLSSFSDKKQLFDYQTKALKNALKVLYLYFQEYEDYSSGESASVTEKRKKKFYQKYSNLYSDFKGLDIKPAKKNEYLFDIYKEHFPPNDNGIICFDNFVNRLSLWMATASGKTLVIIKLFEMIQTLIERDEIPDNDILFLAPKDKIIVQTIELAQEYNLFYKNKFIRFVSLKDYEKDKMESRLTSEDEITIYYYRSDNINDSTGDAFLDYKNYLNDGQWYIVLDEAHKGSKENSKKQAYYTLMSNRGFLFNLSATFTDVEDFITNAYNFNLEKFIMNGYGKNIYVSEAEFNFVQSDEDRINVEKQKIVFKSLILLAASKISNKRIKAIGKSYYHSPLGVTLTNTVTKEHSDLHLYFNELKNFAENKFKQQVFDEAKEELVKEIKKKQKFIFDIQINGLDLDLIKGINPHHVLLEVFNSESFSGIEYLDSKDQKEIGLRLKSSVVSSPFALIRIGDIGEWKNSILNGYSYTGSFDVKNYFDNLNQNENINILLGSRAFYEGWDSPRPNVMSFINIGKSDAKKFILQAIGRGIRLEPVKNYRKRLRYLYNENKIHDDIYHEIAQHNTLLESLFIFATDQEMIESILTSLEEQKTSDKEYKITLHKNKNKHELFVPIYKEVKKDFGKLPRFSISRSSLERLKNYFESTPNGVLMMQFSLNPKEINFLREFLTKESNIKIDENHNFNDLALAIVKLTALIRSNDKVLDGFKQMDEEIIHFLNVKAAESDYQHIQKEVSKVSKFVELSSEPDKLMKELLAGRIAAQANYKDLDIKYLAQHFYYPLISSNEEKVDYINHIIKVDSEVKFIKKLEKYLEEYEEVINESYDWWMFSKVDESLDKIYIPYNDLDRLRMFIPDITFWMQKGNEYRIIFVDPKGTSQSSFINKVSGYERFFKGQKFNHKGYNITVDLVLFNDINPFSDNYYSNYWKDDIKDIFF